MLASLDMPPFAFIENDRFTESPSAQKSLLWIGGKEEARLGPAAPGFESEQVLPMFVRKSAEWITARKGKPFLLYLALNSPHTPVAPTQKWKGKSGMGDYADFVMQTDAAGEDSFSILPLLKGANKPIREHAVNTSIGGVPSVRQGGWKYIAAPRSGGWGKGGDQSQLMSRMADHLKKGQLEFPPARTYQLVRRAASLPHGA